MVDEQQRGEYRPICRSCDFYKSIYRARWSDRRRGSLSLEEFWENLGKSYTSSSSQRGSRIASASRSIPI